MNVKVDEFLANAQNWQEEMTLLRNIVLDCGLTEELKWKQPCYTYKDTNILIISSFKSNCVLSFIKGVLLQDAASLLVSPGENSQSVRFMKFTSAEQIKNLQEPIKNYIFEALEIEKAGLKAPSVDNNNLVYPIELQQILNNDSAFKKAFETLTPGRKRAYNMFFTATKQAETRMGRIEKYYQQILSGKGINDCTCGHSKKMPTCDGSHKYL
jgi:uncharacterized protein YdeI (YjbR/CyaY-like superfamily)